MKNTFFTLKKEFWHHKQSFDPGLEKEFWNHKQGFHLGLQKEFWHKQGFDPTFERVLIPRSKKEIWPGQGG